MFLLVLPTKGITAHTINKRKISLPVEVSKPLTVCGIENIKMLTQGRNTEINPTREKRKINFL